jgi:hypothetical protein
VNKEKVVAIAAVSLVAYTLALGLFNSASSPAPVQTRDTISSGGAVKAIGVMVYSDVNVTNRLTSIDWGVVEPGEDKNVICYIRNEGNFAVTLSLLTENWSPSNASQYITLSWNYDGHSIGLGEIVEVTINLDVSDSVSGITDFSFDLVIVGSG